MVMSQSLQLGCFHYYLSLDPLSKVMPKMERGLASIIARPPSEYATCSEENQRRNCSMGLDVPECPEVAMLMERGKQYTPTLAFSEAIALLRADKGQASKYNSDVSDDQWELIVPFLVPFVRSRSGGSPQNSLRTMINGIYYRTKTGCQWEYIPREFGSKSALHEFYQNLNGLGILGKILAVNSLYFEALGGYANEDQAFDGTLIQAPARAKMEADEGFGANPTDRARKGTKLHVRCDANGTPLAISIVGANVHDSQLVGDNFKKIFAPFETIATPLDGELYNAHLDAAYIGQPIEDFLTQHLFSTHIRPRGEESKTKKECPPRRYVVEQVMAWLKGFRCIRTRYTCYLHNFLGDVQLASMRIIWRRIAKMI